MFQLPVAIGVSLSSNWENTICVPLWAKVGYWVWQFFPWKVNLSKSLILEIQCNLWFCFVKGSTSSAWVATKYYDPSVSVRIDAAVLRCADKMQHWLAETLAGRGVFLMRYFSYSGWMRLLSVCWCDCPAFAWQSAFLVMFLLNMRAVFMLQNLTSDWRSVLRFLSIDVSAKIIFSQNELEYSCRYICRSMVLV